MNLGSLAVRRLAAILRYRFLSWLGDATKPLQADSQVAESLENSEHPVSGERM